MTVGGCECIRETEDKKSRVSDTIIITNSSSFERQGSSHSNRGAGSPPEVQRVLMVFEISGEDAAFPIQHVKRIAPMARLARPPGIASMLEGILNLEGAAVPVLRLDRLFQLKEQPPGLYSMLVVMEGVADGLVAMLVDRVSRIVTVAESAVFSAGGKDSFNECAEGIISLDQQVIHLLSPARILLAKERKALSEFQEIAQGRLRDWGLS